MLFILVAIAIALCIGCLAMRKTGGGVVWPCLAAACLAFAFVSFMSSAAMLAYRDEMIAWRNGEDVAMSERVATLEQTLTIYQKTCPNDDATRVIKQEIENMNAEIARRNELREREELYSVLGGWGLFSKGEIS